MVFLRRIFLIAGFSSLALSAWAQNQVFLPPFAPVSPIVTAQGRAFTAVADGYDALFTNPSGFSRSPLTITLLSVQGTLNASPTQASSVLNNLSAFQNLNATSLNSSATFIQNLVSQYGIGESVNAGIGWVGNNLGLAVALQEDSWAKGQNLLSTTGTIDETLGMVIGYSVPFDLKWAKLHIGLDTRPMQRTYTDSVGLTDVLGSSANLSSIPVYNGFGIGWDWGAILDFGMTKTGSWTAGFVLRDIGSTVFNFHQTTLGQVTQTLGFVSPTGTAPTTTYRIPMVIGVGGSWKPDMGARQGIIDPRLEADLQIPLEDSFTQPSFWTWLHLGGQVTFLKFLSVRAGLNQGYFTFGFGIKMAVVDINASIYSDELGQYAGVLAKPGISVETALRF